MSGKTIDNTTLSKIPLLYQIPNTTEYSHMACNYLPLPNLTFPEPIEMGENVWIYMGELCPAYCLYTPWEDGEKK